MSSAPTLPSARSGTNREKSSSPRSNRLTVHIQKDRGCQLSQTFVASDQRMADDDRRQENDSIFACGRAMAGAQELDVTNRPTVKTTHQTKHVFKSDTFGCGRRFPVRHLGLAAGQLSYDRSKSVGEIGSKDEIGESNFLPSPLDFLDRRCRVSRKYRQRVRRAKRRRVGVGGRHERRDPCRRLPTRGALARRPG